MRGALLWEAHFNKKDDDYDAANYSISILLSIELYYPKEILIKRRWLYFLRIPATYVMDN